MIPIEFTTEEIEMLVKCIDATIRANGLAAANDLMPVFKKIELANAKFENRKIDHSSSKEGMIDEIPNP